MKNVRVALMLIPILLAAPHTLAQSQPAPHGLGASVMAGLNMCLEHGEAKCTNIDPSAGFSGGLLYRFLDFLAVDANIYYGLYSTNADGASSLGFLVGPRAFLPLGSVDLSLGFGIGWGRYEISFRDLDIHGTTSGLQMGLSVGADVLIGGNFGVGLLGRFMFPAFDEFCGSSSLSGGVETCGDFGDEYITYEMMLGLQLTYYFGI